MIDGELETAADMLQAIRRREVAVSELVERALRRNEAWERWLNAFSHVWGDEAMDQARAADAAGEARLPVPVAVKDLFDVAGRETTGCCAAYRGNIAASDSSIVARVRAGGVVLLGKTNQHELAAGGTNEVSACGRTGNPWDPARITGGSSGGSGAAVAAGIVPWALGSDTGGSVRIPASLCGTFGLKPTTGRLPTDGMMPLAPSLDCPGPLASTVEDLRILYGLMAGMDEEERGEDRRGAGSRRPRIGVVEGGVFSDRVHPEALSAVRDVAGTLERGGVEVEPVDGSGIHDARRVWMRVCTPEFAEAHPSLVGEGRSLVAPQVASWLEMGERLSPEERREAGARREEIGGWFQSRLRGVDALLIPTVPYPAPRSGERTVDLGPAGTVDVERVSPGWLTCSVNLSGLPALNLPGRWSADGLPVGASLVAADDGEETLFTLARRWEQEAGYAPRRPAPPA